MDIVEVTWGDAVTSDPLAYISPGDALQIEEMLSKNVGYLLRNDRKGVVLAAHVAEPGYRQVTFIPKSCVIRIRKCGRAKE